MVTTETGAMFHDLLFFICSRIEGNRNHVDPVYAKVLIAVEQVHTPGIACLLFQPQRLHHLAGLLASLNTEIVCARGSTDPITLRTIEAGFPKEMAEIASVIDDAVGTRGSSGGSYLKATGKRRVRPGPMQSR